MTRFLHWPHSLVHALALTKGDTIKTVCGIQKPKREVRFAGKPEAERLCIKCWRNSLWDWKS